MIFLTICLILLFGIASWIDFKSYILPNWITLPLMCIGLCFNAISLNPFCAIEDAAIGLVIGYGFIRLIAFVYLKLKNQQGIGQGDAKLLGAIGAILGYQMVFPVLFIASILGLIFGIIITYRKSNKLSQAIPFGPFLSISACMFLVLKTI
jgi:leader peptidase (prepilin peptidase) / N-methyltransferase